MNQPAKLSKTGITGWRRVTASDLRTSTENSRSSSSDSVHRQPFRFGSLRTHDRRSATNLSAFETCNTTEICAGIAGWVYSVGLLEAKTEILAWIRHRYYVHLSSNRPQHFVDICYWSAFICAMSGTRRCRIRPIGGLRPSNFL